MTGLILHIGLPKTATTTIQYEIFASPANRHLYLGKYPQGDDVFHTLISDYLSGRQSRDETRQAIAPFLVGRGTGLYSNEMITVDSTISWREKLRWLRELFSDIRVEVIATTRMPSKHAHSAYAEMQPATGWRDFDAFLDADQSAWLDPSVLHSSIIEAGLAPAERITFFDFDVLVDLEFRPLATAIPGLVFPDSLANLNARQRVSDAIVSRPIGVYDLAYRTTRRLGLFRILPPKFSKSVGRILRTLPITWRRKMHLPSNTTALETLDAKYCEALRQLPVYHDSNALTE